MFVTPEYFEALRAVSQPIRAADWQQTLDPMRRLIDALGNPQQGYRSIVVTGSTGKGTTSLRIAEMLRAGGQRVGLYTSPHLHLFRERFAILDPYIPPDTEGARRTEGSHHASPAPISPHNPLDSHPASPTPSPSLITQSEFVEVARLVLAAQQTLDHHYSTFETATAIALCWFAHQQVEIAVLEVGIGGRFDAVNALENALAVFTPIESEHLAMLGGSLESIAWHKAGIIRHVAISVPQTPLVMAALQREARQREASLQIADSIEPEDLESLGMRAAPLQKTEYSLPGRLEMLTINGRTFMIDGGHTPAAARYVHLHVHPAASLRLIFGMLRDKNVPGYLSVFDPLDSLDAQNVHFVYAQAPGDRALTPAEILARYAPLRASVTLAPSLEQALFQAKTAPESLVLIAGSLRMASAAREAYGLLSPTDLEESRLTRAIFEGEEYQKKLP